MRSRSVWTDARHLRLSYAALYHFVLLNHICGFFQGEPGPRGADGAEGPMGPPGSLFVIPLNLGVGGSAYNRAAHFRQLLQQHLVRHLPHLSGVRANFVVLRHHRLQKRLCHISHGLLSYGSCTRTIFHDSFLCNKYNVIILNALRIKQNGKLFWGSYNVKLQLVLHLTLLISY